MTGKYVVNVSDFKFTNPDWDKERAPMLRFHLTEGFVPEGKPDDSLLTTFKGCLLTFGAGREAVWSYPKIRLGRMWVSIGIPTTRKAEMVLEALTEAGVVTELRKRVDEYYAVQNAQVTGVFETQVWKG